MKKNLNHREKIKIQNLNRILKLIQMLIKIKQIIIKIKGINGINNRKIRKDEIETMNKEINY